VCKKVQGHGRHDPSASCPGRFGPCVSWAWQSVLIVFLYLGCLEICVPHFYSVLCGAGSGHLPIVRSLRAFLRSRAVLVSCCGTLVVVLPHRAALFFTQKCGAPGGSLLESWSGRAVRGGFGWREEGFPTTSRSGHLGTVRPACLGNFPGIRDAVALAELASSVLEAQLSLLV